MNCPLRSQFVRILFAASLATRSRFARLGSLHHDQRGTISILTVFAVLILAMIMGLVMNVARQVDRKVRMQNAADAAAYAGGVTIARTMNALTFTNHLLCDVFALTAYLREARDRDAESLVPDILNAWKKAGTSLSKSGFAKFDALGQAIVARVPIEKQAIQAFGDLQKASSDYILPIMENILQQELIPKFQRSLVEFMPQVAQLAVQQVALEHGKSDSDSGNNSNTGTGASSGSANNANINTKLQAALWRTDVTQVGTGDGFTASVDLRTIPVVDPSMDNAGGQYKNDATQQRKNLATNYLGQWNYAAFGQTFDDQPQQYTIPKIMARFSYLWRGFTCGKLNDLLNEYPDTNLPFQIRTPIDQMFNPTQHLEQKFTFVAVVYRPAISQLFPGLFKNPMQGDTLAFAESRVFIPTRRLIKWPESRGNNNGAGGGGGGGGGGGIMQPNPTSSVPGMEGFPVTGNSPPPSPAPAAPPQAPANPPPLQVIRQGQYWTGTRFSGGLPTSWDLINQNWTAQLVVATTDNLATILQTNPQGLSGVQLPNLSGLTTQDLRRINTH